MGVDISSVPDPSEDSAPKNIHDLQLAELNFLCIDESVGEEGQSAKKHMFDHCIDHLTTLYHQGKYAQAIDTTFVTQHTMSWAMLAIFGAVVLVITISMLLVC